MIKKKFLIIAIAALSLINSVTEHNVQADSTASLPRKVIDKSIKIVKEPTKETKETIIENPIENSNGKTVIISDNYSEALTKKEKKKLKKRAKRFYKKEFPYKLLSLRLADDLCFLYKAYPKYKVGNIIIFQAETTHAGEGVYRFITFARKNQNSKWKRISEGY